MGRPVGAVPDHTDLLRGYFGRPGTDGCGGEATIHELHCSLLHLHLQLFLLLLRHLATFSLAALHESRSRAFIIRSEHAHTVQRV